MITACPRINYRVVFAQFLPYAAELIYRPLVYALFSVVSLGIFPSHMSEFCDRMNVRVIITHDTARRILTDYFSILSQGPRGIVI